HPRHSPSFPTRRSSDLTSRSTVTPNACTTRRNTTVEPCGANIPEPGVAHVRVTSGVVMTTSALTGKNPLSAITSKGFAEPTAARSEEHTSELQSRFDLV